jgi:hypothetical protein
MRGAANLKPGSAGVGFYQKGSLRVVPRSIITPFKAADPRILPCQAASLNLLIFPDLPACLVRGHEVTRQILVDMSRTNYGSSFVLAIRTSSLFRSPAHSAHIMVTEHGPQPGNQPRGRQGGERMEELLHRHAGELRRVVLRRPAELTPQSKHLPAQVTGRFVLSPAIGAQRSLP